MKISVDSCIRLTAAVADERIFMPPKKQFIACPFLNVQIFQARSNTEFEFSF